MGKHEVERRDSTAVGGASKELEEYKDKLGLPKWKDLSKEHEALAQRHGAGFADALHDKVELYKKFTDYQAALYLNFTSSGTQNMMVFHNLTDLQMKLFELEEQLRKEGINPLMSPEWMDARRQLQKEMEFIQKHKLDLAQFQMNAQRVKEKHIDDDDLFVVAKKDNDKE